ncbi:MAG: hypothetical protein IIW96_02555 [Oscillibacter sp.]|nr:hypothetical protein [Oscillibacter sp.]
MSYQDWFRNAWGAREDGRAEVRVYLCAPEKLTLDRIPWNDQQAARAISEAETLIQNLKEYRQALAARYSELTTAAYTLRLELIRHPAWGGHGVTFDLRIIKRYEDGTEVDELREHYTGKQRREALARYAELKKQRPGIDAVLDIQRRTWER